MEKTIRVDVKYFDKLKALADAAGASKLEAANGVLEAGLGELKAIGKEAARANSAGVITLRGKELPVTDEEITITEPVAEPKAKAKAEDKPKVKAKAEKQAEEAVEYVCVKCGSPVDEDDLVCSVCDSKLDWEALKEADDSEESEGNDSWVWVVGLLVAALALRRRMAVSNRLSGVA